ncbi:hypothetical protein P3342_009874 [Pyrenophora teres f. teres]|nr:hypothetical protein P3342_009874 [Pyrenophora teres f. teres]
MAHADVAQILDSIARTLISNTNLIHAPKKAQDARLTATIADLHVHPAIEALLHIVNHDLPSAHFLVRHMQAPPAVEGMLLHGILHRAEGDFNNAKAWISDVSDACEGYQPKKKEEGLRLDAEIAKQVGNHSHVSSSLVIFVYGDEGPLALINAVEALRGRKQSERKEDEMKMVEKKIREEAEKVLGWCTSKFGEGAWKDATKAWVKNSEEINKISGDMVSGEKGYRKF